jgi:hypothetical protein
MDHYTEDKEAIMSRISDLLDEKYSNLKETGNFAPSDIGREIGKIIGEYNIKKKFKNKLKIDKQMDSLFGMYSQPSSSLFDEQYSCCSECSLASTQCASVSAEPECEDNDSQVSSNSMGSLKELSSFFGTLFV